MWYIAAIPFVLLTSFFIYNMVAERKVNLAIEKEGGTENDHGKLKLVEAISKVLSESSKKTSVEAKKSAKSASIKKVKNYGVGSILLSVKIVKDSEIDMVSERYVVFEPKKESKKTIGQAE